MYFYTFLFHDNLNNKLHFGFYIVPLSVINDRDRFVDLKDLDPSVVLWGVYDPMTYNRNQASIVLSEHKDIEGLKALFAHELAHYWYDRFCWSRKGGNEEEFVYGFQSYYTRNKFGRVIR